jgi:hypothetical protein
MDPKWILKGLVESVLVVGSILLALAVDEWSQSKEYADLADQTLAIFDNEIRQNRARIADLSPYHQGIRDLLGQMMGQEAGQLDVRPIVEGFEAPVLLNTAWETALATGALTHMGVDVVSALSLTYSIQEGFEERTRADRPRFQGPGTLSSAQNREQVADAYQYVASIARAEAELLSVFDQALEVIHGARGGSTATSDSSPESEP